MKPFSYGVVYIFLFFKFSLLVIIWSCFLLAGVVVPKGESDFPSKNMWVKKVEFSFTV